MNSSTRTHMIEDIPVIVPNETLALPPLRSLPAQTIDIAVAGASRAGLAAAVAAAEAGARVLVLEARSSLAPDGEFARLAERARRSGVVLAGAARVIRYVEERGCATSTHWRLDMEGGVAVPARGLIVAYDEKLRHADAASAPRPLGRAAPGLAIGGPAVAGAAERAGHAAGAEVATLVARRGSCAVM